MIEDWVKCRFEDLLDYEQPTNYIVNSTEYDDSYETPVLTAGKSFIKGYTNEKDGIFDNLPTIIFDDFTTASQFVNFKFKVKSSAMKILVPTSDLINMKFVYYAMQINKVRSDTHKRYWISIYSKKEIFIPSVNEQRAIVAKIEELFSDLDKGVTDLKKAQDQLKVYRQAVLKKAFEGELTNVNMIVKKLSDECEIIMGQSPPGSSYNQEGIGTPLINGPVEFGEGPLGKTVKSKWTTKPTKLCKKGDLILCVRGSTTGKTNIANFEACVGRGVAAIRFNSNQEYLNSYMLFKRYEVFTKGTGSTFPSVSSKELREFDFPICSQEEQHQIVQEIESRLSVCDKVEENITESLEKAKALRQSILKKALEGNLLSIQEIEKCKTEADYEPAVVLLEKIKNL